MTRQAFNELVAQIEHSLEGYPNGQLIVAIGRCQNAIGLDKGWPEVDVLSSYVEYVTPFLHQAVLTEDDL